MSHSLDIHVYYAKDLLMSDLRGIQQALMTVAPVWSRGVVIKTSDGKKIALNLAKPLEQLFLDTTRPGKLFEALVAADDSINLDPKEYRGTVELNGSEKNVYIFIEFDSCICRHISGQVYFPNSVSVQIRRATVEKRKAYEWAEEFFYAICELPSAIYGFVSDSDEFAHKNLDTSYGVRAVGRDMGRALPGFYWLNFFGERYCDLIGRDTLDTAPCYSTSIGKGKALKVYKDPTDWASAEFRQIEQKCLIHLGQQYFFSKETGFDDKIAPDYSYLLKSSEKRFE